MQHSINCNANIVNHDQPASKEARWSDLHCLQDNLNVCLDKAKYFLAHNYYKTGMLTDFAQFYN